MKVSSSKPLMNMTKSLILTVSVLAKSGSESSISEACDNDEKVKNAQSEAVERGESTEKDDATKTIRKEILEVPMGNMSKRGSLTSAKSLHELKREPLIDEPSGNQDPKADSGEAKKGGDDAPSTSKGIRPSKSETSIIDSFVVVENEYARRKNNANLLREGSAFGTFISSAN